MASNTPETYPLVLTEPEREALIHATRLRARTKNRLKDAPEGKQPVAFTQKELNEISEETNTAAKFAFDPYRKRLVTVEKKVMRLLDAVVDKPEASKQRRRTRNGNDRVFQFKITLKGSSRRSGGASRPRTVRWTSFTNISRRRWAGPTLICTSS